MYQEYKIINNPHITSVFTAFIRNMECNYRFDGETHDFWELVCVTDGKVGVTAGSKVFSLKKGQAMLHSPMQFHRLYNEHEDTSTVVIFSFNGTNIPDCSDRICKINNISEVYEIYELCKNYYEIFDNLNITSVKEKHDLNYLKFPKELECLLISLATNVLDDNTPLSQRAKNFSVIVNTLENNIDRRLTIHDIASLCNMSEINVKKTFSKYAGVGIIEYFNRLKIKKAIEMLNNGCSVKETALFLGFNDQNYFSTVFKRITGHSPTHTLKRC